MIECPFPYFTNSSFFMEKIWTPPLLGKFLKTQIPLLYKGGGGSNYVKYQ